MDKKLIILRGLPSSGKTTLVKTLIKTIIDSYYICSADNWFINDEGHYIFNPSKLYAAHLHCRKSAFMAMDCLINNVIVDNTNTTWSEIKDYVEYGKRYGYDIFLAEPNTKWKFDVQELVRKNTHGVPIESIQKMLDRWQNSDRIMADHPEIKYYE